VPPKENNKRTPSRKFLFKLREGTSGNDFGKPFVFKNRFAVLSAERIEDEISDEQGWVDNDQRRNKFDDSMGDE
jgi:hypothetical protein